MTSPNSSGVEQPSPATVQPALNSGSQQPQPATNGSQLPNRPFPQPNTNTAAAQPSTASLGQSAVNGGQQLPPVAQPALHNGTRQPFQVVQPNPQGTQPVAPVVQPAPNGAGQQLPPTNGSRLRNRPLPQPNTNVAAAQPHASPGSQPANVSGSVPMTTAPAASSAVPLSATVSSPAVVHPVPVQPQLPPVNRQPVQPNLGNPYAFQKPDTSSTGAILVTLGIAAGASILLIKYMQGKDVAAVAA